MDMSELMSRAEEVRSHYAEVEQSRYGRPWNPEEIMLGFVGDVGDLAKLVQGKAGVRATHDLDRLLAHELADCLWSVLTLAAAYQVDLEQTFTDTMDQIVQHLDQQDPPAVDQGVDPDIDQRPC